VRFPSKNPSLRAAAKRNTSQRIWRLFPLAPGFAGVFFQSPVLPRAIETSTGQVRIQNRADRSKLAGCCLVSFPRFIVTEALFDDRALFTKSLLIYIRELCDLLC
jgi:hypothetical protein